MLPPVWCTTYIILLYQCYTISEKSIALPTTIRRHLHRMNHPLDLQFHPLQYVCSPFEGEGEGEGELIAKVVVEMVGEVMVEMVRAVVVHLSRYCILHPIFLYPHTDTSPSILLDTYTSLPYPVSLEPASIAVDITFSSHPLSSPALPPIGDTILNFVSELGPLPARRLRAPRIRRVLHLSAPSTPLTPSAPSTPFEIARNPIDQQVMYYRSRHKRNIKTPSCGTH